MDVRISDQPSESEYRIWVDGVQADKTAYRDVGSMRVFYHTRIEDEFGGQGLAGRLASAALADAKERGFRIVPVCPYIAHYLESHHEVDDVIDKPTPEILAALES